MDEYGRFTLLYDPLISPALRPIHRGIISLLTKKGCASMADLCCGTGVLAGMAARTGMEATGVDLSPAMLGVATRKQPGRFIRADATTLPLRDDSLDCATISFSLHEKPQATALTILSEARRIVRPGGLIVVADYREPGPDGGKWTGRTIALVERMAGREHHACFRKYMNRGGTDTFLRTAQMTGQCEQAFLNGWAGVYTIPVPE